MGLPATCTDLRNASELDILVAMERVRFDASQCPIARSVSAVGDPWNILILRDAFHKLRRFGEFQASLGIAPNILARHLKALVDHGLLERRQYCARPSRHEYVLTERGRDFFPVLAALLSWGNKHLAPEGIALQLADIESGVVIEPIVVDRKTMRPVISKTVTLAIGSAAGSEIHERVTRVRGSPSNRGAGS